MKSNGAPTPENAATTTATQDTCERGRRPSAEDLLGRPDAYLSRGHLRDLGLERRAVDAVFRAVPVVALPGYSRPLIRVRDYIELLKQSTFGAGGDRVRPTGRSAK